MISTINVHISGITPLLVNRFHEEGDKRDFPSHEAECEWRLYQNGHGPFVPSEWLRQSIIESAKRFKIPGQRTRAATTDVAAACAVYPFEILLEQPWRVDSRAVVIKAAGGARVMRNRPMFDQWELEFQVEVDTALVPESLAKEILAGAGAYVGIGDFRPARKGQYGRFSVTSWKKAE